MLKLNDKNILGEGTARVVYIHPDDSSKCVKVATLEKIKEKKKKRGFRAKFRRLSFFDPTDSETKIFLKLILKKGFVAWKHIPMFYGFVDTNKGRGLVFEHVGEQNLEAYLKVNKYDKKVEKKLIEIRDFFLDNNIHFSDWRASNFVVKWNAKKTDYIICAIDGFEYTEFIPITRIPYFSRRKIRRRFARFLNPLRAIK